MRVLRRIGLVSLWIFTVLLAFLFVMIGVGKFADASWTQKFARWGYPDGFYMVIGVLEIAGGLALLVPRTATYGAVLIGVIMLGASATHAIHGESARIFPPLMYLAFATVVGLARRRSALRWTTRRTPAGLEPV